MEIKFLKKKRKFRKGGMGISPDLYWSYILYITFAGIVLSCAFGLYLFMRISNESTPLVISANGDSLIKKERIDKVLEYFGEREKKSAEILNSPSPIVDPSL
jgi:hypothetical protein